MLPSFAYDSGTQASDLIDVDGSPDRDHRVESLDVFIAHTHATVADGLSDGFRMVSSMNAIAVSQFEAAGTEASHISARGGGVGRHNCVCVHDDLLSFDPST